jgi:hypothetical protein
MRHEQTLDNWKKRLAGETIPTYEADPDIGYYRKRTKDIKTNVVTWMPVAYFIAEGELVGVIGPRDMTKNEVGDLWTFVCQYPIPEEVYFAADAWCTTDPTCTTFEWPAGLLGEPKRPPFKQAPTMEEEIAGLLKGENRPAGNLVHDNTTNAPPEVPLVEQHQTAINNAIAAAPKQVPTTAEQCALVEGSKNRIAELRLAADKAGKAIYEPIYRQYTTEQKKWSPIVSAASTAEKALGQLVLTFRERERQRIAKEQAEAVEKQRAIDEANARAADRAIAAGKPEPAPVVEEVKAPTLAPVAPTYGKRTTKAELKVILDDITDYDAVYQYFKNTEEVRAALTVLARVAVAAGRAVPGTKTREGLI